VPPPPAKATTAELPNTARVPYLSIREALAYLADPADATATSSSTSTPDAAHSPR